MSKKIRNKMSNSLILEQVSKSELKDLIREAVAAQFSQIHQTSAPAKELGIMTRAETAKMLNITLCTLHDWTKRGIIQGARIGTRVRYRLADVENALQDIEHVKYSRKR
jgi:excisionase family DNA binding protein